MGSSSTKTKSNVQQPNKEDANVIDLSKNTADNESVEDFYDLHVIDYYQKNEETNEIIDCRMEPLIKIFGRDIPLVVMSYLNAMYSILTQSFKLEIEYNTLKGGCECTVYFNRNDYILAQNNECYNNKMPLECAVEVSFKMNNCKLFKYMECKATLSIIYVDCNAKLNVELPVNALQSKEDKYNTNILMECIQITFIRPSFSTICQTEKAQNDLEEVWKNEYLFESSAVTEFLSSNQEYGPILYSKDIKSIGLRFCRMTFNHCNEV